MSFQANYVFRLHSDKKCFNIFCNYFIFFKKNKKPGNRKGFSIVKIL